MKGRFRFLLGAVLLSGIGAIAPGQELLYGGNGGQGQGRSINPGALVIVDTDTAAVTIVGLNTGAAKLTGIAFDSTGTLYASTLPEGNFPPPTSPANSKLITLDPATGEQTSLIGTIVDGPGGAGMAISDISIQPGTDVLFGIRSEVDAGGGQGNLYTIDKATGVATFVGDTGVHFATIAFAPDGTLYESTASFSNGPVNPRFRTINPSNGAVLTEVSTAQFFGALAVRSDGTVFGGTGGGHELYIVNPSTGALIRVGDTGLNFVGGLAFHKLSSGPCAPDDFTLCLNNDRFSVFTRWRTPDGRTGQGHAQELTNDSGYFWIFNSANIEIVTQGLERLRVQQPLLGLRGRADEPRGHGLRDRHAHRRRQELFEPSGNRVRAGAGHGCVRNLPLTALRRNPCTFSDRV